MGKDVSTELGQITISDEVIALIAGMAATECYGLVGMASRNIQDGIAELLGMENLSRGVEVKLAGDEVVIDLYIIVEYGTKITEVAHNVMDKVRYVVESMTGLKVARVNITVQGVRVTHVRQDKRT
ncbi:MAG: Asp23/Gls24 family envelope stress response protein [Bacillota bacterium]|nr:Asp23/Gls24 family envelope stress response protein [Bacillota bacterium]